MEFNESEVVRHDTRASPPVDSNLTVRRISYSRISGVKPDTIARPRIDPSIAGNTAAFGRRSFGLRAAGNRQDPPNCEEHLFHICGTTDADVWP